MKDINMKLHKSQTGFTAVHALLFLVILGIIGIAGWKVYSTGKAPNIVESNPSNKQEQPNPATSTIPDGFVEYQNKELGFKFAYPKEWGNVSLGEYYDKRPVASGTITSLRFSNLNDATIVFFGKDLKTQNVFSELGAEWGLRCNDEGCRKPDYISLLALAGEINYGFSHKFNSAKYESMTFNIVKSVSNNDIINGTSEMKLKMPNETYFGHDTISQVNSFYASLK